jgi:hypothetical protein
MSSLKKTVFVCWLALALALGLASPSSAFLDKTRFVAHLGVAYFAFHHFVLKPYQEGSFAPGAEHRVSTIIKGGVALLFAVHEAKVADKIAATSNDPLLEKVHGAIVGMTQNFESIGDKLKSGQFHPDDIAALSGSASSLKSVAQAAGIDIKDKAVPIPGL